MASKYHPSDYTLVMKGRGILRMGRSGRHQLNQVVAQHPSMGQIGWVPLRDAQGRTQHLFPVWLLKKKRIYLLPLIPTEHQTNPNRDILQTN